MSISTSYRLGIVFLFVALVPCGLSSIGTLAQQQDEQLTPLTIPIPSHPTTVDPAKDITKDPLFQELTKAFLKQSQSSNAPFPGSLDSQKIPSGAEQHNPAGDLSDHRWHAIECLLHAARQLETEERTYIQRNHAEGAARIRASIRTIRQQALQLTQP